MRKYIGMDAHLSSITFAVKDEQGNLLSQNTLALNEKLIKDYVKKIKGPKYLTFEEGPMAQWLYNMLSDKVDKLVVCNPLKNALIYKGSSNDDIDSKDLAELLRLNSLSEVKHPDSKNRQEFRELINLYFKIRKEITRTKNRLKAVFRMKGIPTAGSKIYNPKNKEEYLKLLSENTTAKESANTFWRQLEFLNNEKNIVYENILKRSKSFKEVKIFMEEPGVGLITASTFSAKIFTPWRFENKGKVWAYCGLSLEENDTGKKIDKEKERRRKKKILRRLTNDGSKDLKSELKSASQCAIFRCKDNEYQHKYAALIAKGLRSESAVLSVTRYLVSKLYGKWKDSEREEKNKNITKT